MTDGPHPTTTRPARVAVVGGGITGLAAAWYLRTRDPALEVTVLEATPRVGGKLRTESLDGRTVEAGADSFLVRTPEALDLCRELGLDLAAPATGRVQVWHDGRLHALPEGLVLGAPSRIGPLLSSGLLSLGGALRAGLDLVLPREVDVDRESVGELLGHRFGRQVVERVADPLLSGVYAGDVDRLGAAAATPQLADAARTHRSLLVGLRARDRTPPAGGSLFRTVEGGLGRLVERLRADVPVRTNAPVRLIQRDRAGYRLQVSASQDVTADAVVVASPAFAASSMLRDLAPDAADALREIRYASVAVVALAYPPDAGSLTGSGVLVPSVSGRLVKAATWVSEKWPHLAGGGEQVVRASVGRSDDASALALDDDELVRLVDAEVRELADLTSVPVAARVFRWERALPQYETRHLDRVARIDAALEDLPGLALAGAAYRGIGITACVADADRAARRVRGAVGARA